MIRVGNIIRSLKVLETEREIRRLASLNSALKEGQESSTNSGARSTGWRWKGVRSFTNLLETENTTNSQKPNRLKPMQKLVTMRLASLKGKKMERANRFVLVCVRHNRKQTFWEENGRNDRSERQPTVAPVQNGSHFTPFANAGRQSINETGDTTTSASDNAKAPLKRAERATRA